MGCCQSDRNKNVRATQSGMYVNEDGVAVSNKQQYYLILCRINAKRDEIRGYLDEGKTPKPPKIIVPNIPLVTGY